ncbi:unnamed protein product [Phytomonas sp. Hart1]|nr:unnamed protein product [Phytomonas sp. Hart1]|eukprot:CCW68977.1 unnamed protein product [Phytomonas sp. isolate Hart1]
MTESISEEFRINGNKAFAEKRFDEAIILYTKAIENDPSNFIYFSNRAAAHHELREYDEAIRDAKKSISINDNVKAHVRIATSLWAQRKLEEADAEYKVALGLDPSNQGVKNSLKVLEELLDVRRSAHRTSSSSASSVPNVMMNGAPLPPLCGGEFATAAVSDAGAAIALIIFVVNLLFTVSSFMKPVLMIFLWRTLLCVLILQQGLNLYLRGMIPRKMDDLKVLVHHFPLLLLSICLIALLIKVPPQLFLATFALFYDLIDLLNHKNKLLVWAGPLQNILLPYFKSIETNRYNILMMAASFEVMVTFPIMLTSGSVFTLVYIQYIKTRYVYDRYVQAAFSDLRKKVTKLTSMSFLPPFVNVYVQKFFDMLYTMSQQTI